MNKRPPSSGSTETLAATNAALTATQQHSLRYDASSSSGHQRPTLTPPMTPPYPSVSGVSTSITTSASETLPVPAATETRTLRARPPRSGAAAETVPSSSIQVPVTSAKPKRVRVKTERRREQCRKNQERYRNKQNKGAVDLEIVVQRLRLEVLQLEDRRRSLYRTINTRESALHMLMEYFRLFRYGLQSGLQVALLEGRPSQQTQVAFLRTNFHDKIRVEGVRGLDAYIELTTRFSTLYDNLLIELVRCQEWSATEVSTTLQITQRLLLTISQTTITQVFPHLQRPENDRIKWKLLGQQIEFTVCGTFHLDERGTVVELDWTMDFGIALEQVLTVEEIAVVLKLAQIVRDGNPEEDPTASPQAEEEEEEEEKGESSDDNAVELQRSNERWLGAEQWRDTQRVHLYERQDDEEEDEGEGYLIHDGKGDDYVMV